jgi:hypothetical protein
MNLFYTKTWQYDAHTKEVIFSIEKHADKTKPNLGVSCEWIFEPTLNYYISSRKMNINPSTQDEINSNADFIYKLNDNKPLPNFVTLATYNDISTILLMKTDFKEVKPSH